MKEYSQLVSQKVVLAALQELEPNHYRLDFITEDSLPLKMSIDMGDMLITENAVAFVREAMLQETRLRRQAAEDVFSRNDLMMRELEYTTANDLHRALEPEEMCLFWERQSCVFIYVSPLDDLELYDYKHFIRVDMKRGTSEVEISLEQD
ncbi:MAG: hypothetical protein U1F71_04780 [Verrucomicrobiaceae bacterium]